MQSIYNVHIVRETHYTYSNKNICCYFLAHTRRTTNQADVELGKSFAAKIHHGFRACVGEMRKLWTLSVRIAGALRLHEHIVVVSLLFADNHQLYAATHVIIEQLTHS